jgi:hypothetical protein
MKVVTGRCKPLQRFLEISVEFWELLQWFPALVADYRYASMNTRTIKEGQHMLVNGSRLRGRRDVPPQDGLSRGLLRDRWENRKRDDCHNRMRSMNSVEHRRPS